VGPLNRTLQHHPDLSRSGRLKFIPEFGHPRHQMRLRRDRTGRGHSRCTLDHLGKKVTVPTICAAHTPGILRDANSI
jgi:hypothetical protein